MLTKIVSLILILFISSVGYSMADLGNHPPILKWRKHKVEEGFVLYKYLINKSGCFDNDIPFVWDYHAFAFKEKNPTIADIDNLEVGSEIILQTCKLVKKKSVKLVPTKIDQKKLVPKEEPISTVAEPEKVVEIKEEGPTTSEDENLFKNSRIMLGVGFLAESHNEFMNSGPAFTFRIKSDFYSTLNHRLMIDFAPSVIYVRNKLDFKTAESKYQFFGSVGIGNRIGLLKRPTDLKMSTTITNYTEGSLGFNVKYSSSLNLMMEVGTTLNSKHPLNFSVTAMKKLGDTPYYLGGYFDYVWTDSSILDTDSNDRKMLTGGVIFSY